jgi:predicted RNase H-like nuclease (RuvC/YqgF family)|tara:strand:+ start:917 stop:1168 length:252 start_codon:yes stop_codon:yes gene_type:complete
MFTKIKKICNFNKKEKQVSTTSTESRTVKSLRNEVKQQKELLASVLDRVSGLSDDISMLKSELDKFKMDVASDVKYLTNRVDR